MMRALGPAPVVEEALVDPQLDAVGAQGIGDADRERLRHDGRPQAERAHVAHTLHRPDLVDVVDLAQDVRDREALGRDDLDAGSNLDDAVSLDAPHDRDASPTDLCVDEGVADRNLDLVSQLGAALAVADEEHVGHGRAAYR